MDSYDLRPPRQPPPLGAAFAPEEIPERLFVPLPSRRRGRPPLPGEPVAEPIEPQLFEFRWPNPDGGRTVLSCYSATAEEAEASARRAGWPGHDGTRLGMFRAWLKQAILDEGPANESWPA